MFPTGQTTVDVIRQIALTQLTNSIPNQDFEDRIVIYNQPYTLPPVDGLWIEIAFVASKIYSTQNYTQIATNGAFQEVQNLYQQEHIMVRLFSKNLQALQYKELVMMGFNSIYAQHLQEQYSFRINNVIPFPDTSELEGGTINYRADLAIMCLTAYQNIITTNYLNNWETQVNVQVNALDALVTQEFSVNPSQTPNYLLVDPSGLNLLDEDGNPIIAG